MPNYKTHHKVSKYLVDPIVFIGSWVILGGDLKPDLETLKELALAGVVTLGAHTGNTLLSPDLDIPSTPYRKWGVLRFLWKPYQIIVRHRSPWSHWMILGPMVAHLYMLTTITIVVLSILGLWNWIIVPHTDIGQVYNAPTIGITVRQVLKTITRPVRYWWYWLFLIGNIIGAVVHSVMDILDSRSRQRDKDAIPKDAEHDEETALRGYYE